MKFIHTSDWHIGRQFHNVSLLEDQKYILKQITDYVKNEVVDALIIAGDIYDRSVPPALAVELLDQVLSLICNEYKVPVILIPGNHDSGKRLAFAAKQLTKTGLYILSDLAAITKAVTIKGQDGQELNFYGIPYNDPEEVRHVFQVDVSGHDQAHTYLVEKIKASMDKNASNILIDHCFLGGAEVSESERPLSLGGSDAVSYKPLMDFTYCALGHLHGPQKRKSEFIRYSGSILKYSFSEQFHKKGVNLVEIRANSDPHIKFLPLKPKFDMRTIESSMQEILESAAQDPHAKDYLLIRLTDRHAILDAMGKLRSVYPNVLHLEKVGIMSTGEMKSKNAQMLKRRPMDMFYDFYEQISGLELSNDQINALEKVIDNIHTSRPQ